MPEQHLLRVHRNSILFEAGKLCLAARKPAHGALAGIFCIMIFSRVFHAFVKSHGNRAAKVGLNAHAFLWTHKNVMTIQMRGKGDPFLCNFPQLRQAEHLKPAGIGKDRPVPSGKAVQTTQPGHIFIARPQMQMIGVAQHHLTMVGLQIKCRQAAFDGAGRCHIHEGGRLHRAVHGFKTCAPCFAFCFYQTVHFVHPFAMTSNLSGLQKMSGAGNSFPAPLSTILQ